MKAFIYLPPKLSKLGKKEKVFQHDDNISFLSSKFKRSMA